MGTIYSLTAPSGSKYVGQTCRELQFRIKEHSEGINNPKLLKRKLYKAISKYGFDNFTVEVLAEDINDFDLLDLLETEWIESYKSNGINLYNLTEGGKYFRGLLFTEEMRKQRSEHSKNLWSKPEHKANITKIQKDLWNDPEYRKKSLERLKIPKTEDHKKNLLNSIKGQNNKNSKLKEEDVINILNKLSVGSSCNELAKEFGVKYNAIWLIKNNKNWKHIERI